MRYERSRSERIKRRTKNQRIMSKSSSQEATEVDRLKENVTGVTATKYRRKN